jgi:hypothetical protein
MRKDNHEDRVHRLRHLSVLLDSKYRGPFGVSFGLDAILGLLPVVGDSVTTVLSGYIILQAALLGCPVPILIRMVTNVLIETVVDLIPLVGNIFDFVWKSNRKNLALLEDYLIFPKRATMKSYLAVGVISLFFLGLLSLLAYGGYQLVVIVYHWGQGIHK